MELYAAYFVAGAMVLAVLAWIWLVVVAFRTHWGWGVGMLVFPPTVLALVPLEFRRCRPPLGLLLLAGVVGCVPFVLVEYDRRFASFGPRERLVEGELHIVLTGWKEKNYQLLLQRPDTVVLEMSNPDVTDDTLEYLKDLKELRELTLDYSQISDAGLVILAGLPKLETLRIAQTGITDEGFQQHLAAKESLLQLDVTKTQIRSKTLRAWKAAREGRKFVN
ncbi:MAG: hypothetical protein U0840_21015 [Gemmataceae bacterium]